MSTIITAALVTFALATPQASPQAEPSELRWRLHADVSPVRMTSQSRGGYGSRSWDLGVPGELSIGFGHTLGRYVLVGTRVLAELRQHSGHGNIGGQDWSSSSVFGGGALLPYAEVRPLPDQRVQPFGLVEGGVGMYGMRRYSETGFTSEPHRSFQINPTVGGRVGLHAFVRPRLSIDADLGLRRYWSFGWSASPATKPIDAASQERRLQLAATVGLSAWW